MRLRQLCTVTFDRQKVLNVSHSNAGQLYYKQLLQHYNFKIYNAPKKIGYRYFWPDLFADAVALGGTKKFQGSRVVASKL